MKKILQGDALAELKKLPSDSVDCCITSPPYYQLRDYGVAGQIGLEATVGEYIEKLVEVFREVRRVLKPDGTLWVNIADSYAGSGKGSHDKPENRKRYKQGTSRGWFSQGTPPTTAEHVKPKDMIGVPWLLALALRADGWYLRQDIIWEKPNCMPESVRDRCTKAHEYVFLLSKSRRYYFDGEAIKEPCVGFDKSQPRGSKGSSRENAGRRKGNRRTFRGGGAYTRGQSFNNDAPTSAESHGNAPNETGLRRKRSVWHVSTTGSKETHYATFPTKLVEPCILAGSRSGGVVLDPFAGSGTVGVVAKSLGRGYALIELKSEYAEICRKRLNEEDEQECKN